MSPKLDKTQLASLAAVDRYIKRQNNKRLQTAADEYVDRISDRLNSDIDRNRPAEPQWSDLVAAYKAGYRAAVREAQKARRNNWDRI